MLACWMDSEDGLHLRERGDCLQSRQGAADHLVGRVRRAIADEHRRRVARADKVRKYIGDGIADGVRIRAGKKECHGLSRILRHDQGTGIAGGAEISTGNGNQIRIVHGEGCVRVAAMSVIADAGSHVGAQNGRAG